VNDNPQADTAEAGTADVVAHDDFLVFLAKEAPASLEELSADLAALAAAVQEHKKPGRITYTVEIKPAKGVDMVLITDSVKSKIPQKDREAVGMRFVHPGGQLNEYPPGQTPFAGMGRGELGGSK
jgi:hypothetical protein